MTAYRLAPSAVYEVVDENGDRHRLEETTLEDARDEALAWLQELADDFCFAEETTYFRGKLFQIRINETGARISQPVDDLCVTIEPAQPDGN